MSIKKTALYDLHLKANAVMIDFHDWLLPLRFSGEMREHDAVRTNAGLFDISHMGEFIVSGGEASKFLNYVLSNNIEKLKIGQAQYTLILNNEAGIIDDLIVYYLEEKKYLLCVNAANILSDYEWLSEKAKLFSDINLVNESSNYALIALQGPKSFFILEKILLARLNIEKFCFQKLKIDTIDALISCTGYTGEKGVEIFVSPSDATKLWQILIDAGHKYGLIPCGLGARDSLRLEAGYLLHGTDISSNITPLESGLMWAVDIKKNDFIGKEVLLRKKQSGLGKHIFSFFLLKKGIPRTGYQAFNKTGNNIGYVSSGSWSHAHNCGFGLAFLDSKLIGVDDIIFIDIRKQLVPAKISFKKTFTN